ncbi:response regulator transcription factor [Cohnella zeiphila]|uniref:Response regulator n=1 Tax=Cohnella zeiphila TaxID=2761120 RepID=A0A7X0SJR2_9BACL|nr:response regulator [Cohnella zeiphila]MBB6731255.1 response regulator [Cohnella zeiphila]
MRTYTCLVVDDEDLIVQRLELFFQGLSAGDRRFELIGKAYNGIKGAELALELKPDIVLSDIVMPQLDGITMIEQLRPKLPNAQYILLTAYSTFEYAQRAIRSHILEYIVKVPLKEEELTRALEKAAETLEDIRKREGELQALNLSIQENRYRVRKQWIGELVSGELPARRATGEGGGAEYGFFESGYCCFIAEMNQYESFRNAYSSADQSVLKFAVTNVLEETLADYGGGAVSELRDHRFVGFLALDGNRSEMEIERICQTLGRQMVDNLERYLNQEVSVGFAGPRKGWDAIRSGYAEAAGLCDDFFYREAKSVVTPAHRLRYRGELGPAFRERVAGVLAQLHRESGREELAEWMGALERSARDERIPKPAMLALLRDFWRDIAAKLKSWGIPELDAEAVPAPFAAFREQLRLIADLVFAALQDGAPSHRTEITRAILYIERHLRQRLTLQELAEQVNLAPAYFSSLFKKTMKEGVVSYINRRKIELSFELLQRRDYSILELCEETGIVNEGYFCKLFKQYAGMTPKRYRNLHQGLKNV